MALATFPLANGIIRPVSKRRLDKPEVIVVMEDNGPSTCSYHKQCLCELIDIYQKSRTMTNDMYDSKITRIVEMIGCEDESNAIFQTLCGVSFLDRCQDKEIIANALKNIDKKISNISWKMEWKLQSKCYHLLTRMGMIENLNSSDTELICLLCQLCKATDQNSALLDLLLEIGRSIWPYLKRPLWHKEPFVDFVADIFETIGDRLEMLYPKNFCIAWKVILRNFISSNEEMSCYSRLRLLTVIELKHRRWSFSETLLEFYREQYNEFTAAKKKEILSFIGFLSSRRKTSLTVKPGRSAADFLKRRQSSESQKVRKCSSPSSGDSSEAFGEVFEDVFEQNDTVLSPENSTSCFRKKSSSNAEPTPSRQEINVNGCHHKNTDRQALLKTVENRNLTAHMKDTITTGQVSSVDQQNVRRNEREEVKEQDETVNRGKQLADKQRETNHGEFKLSENRAKENRSIVLEKTEDYGDEKELKKSANFWQENVGDEMKNKESVRKETENFCQKNEVAKESEKSEEAWEESGNSWQDNKLRKEIKNKEDVWKKSGNSTQDNKLEKEIKNKEDVWEKSGNSMQDNKFGKEMKNKEDVWEESGNSWLDNNLGKAMNDKANGKKLMENIWQESDNTWQENNTIWEDTNCADPRTPSPSNGDKNETNKNFSKEFRSFLSDRKKEVIKVPGKYVGRVIGTQGSVISSIQDESGARVHIVRPPKDKVSARPAFSLSTVKNMVHDTLGLLKDRTLTTGDASTEDVKDDQEEEIEFEIIGSHECIEKAKTKIDIIISHAKTCASHANLKRSFSEGDETNFKSFRRSSYQERKTVIMKVASKYVGRVIGSGGSMIMAIEEESGAKVTFVKDSKREKYRATEHMANMEQKNEAETHNETSKDEEGKQIAGERKDEEVKVHEETVCEGNIEGSKENEEVKSGGEEKFPNQQAAIVLGMWSDKKQSSEEQSDFLSEKDDITTCVGSTVEAANAKVEEKIVEHEFKITGTDETIEKAKKKIERIMELVDNSSSEKRTFARSLSCSSSIRGFKSFKRSLSCPVSNWGECSGNCEMCRKGSYCRSFLLEKSQSASCWVRPPVLSLTQEADWAEYIIKTQIDDPNLWKPRVSSSPSSSGSSEDIFNYCTSPRNVTADQTTLLTTDNTASSLEDLRGSTSSDPEAGSKSLSEDAKQVDEILKPLTGLL